MKRLSLVRLSSWAATPAVVCFLMSCGQSKLVGPVVREEASSQAPTPQEKEAETTSDSVLGDVEFEFTPTLGDSNVVLGGVYLAQIVFVAPNDQILGRALKDPREAKLPDTLSDGKTKIEFYTDAVLTEVDRSKISIKSLTLPRLQRNTGVYFSILNSEAQEFSLNAEVKGFKQKVTKPSLLKKTILKYQSKKPADEWERDECISVQVGEYLQSAEGLFASGVPREIFAKFGDASGVPATVWSLGASGYSDCSGTPSATGRIEFKSNQGLALVKMKRPANALGTLKFYRSAASGLFDVESTHQMEP